MEMCDVREKFDDLFCCERSLADGPGSKICCFIAESRTSKELHCQILRNTAVKSVIKYGNIHFWVYKTGIIVTLKGHLWATGELLQS